MDKNLKVWILLSLILFFGAFLRFWNLDKFPVQLNHDEVSQAYDVSSIVKTGKDIYGNFLPLAFKSTGDYKVGHYIYLSILSYLIFDSSEVMIRIPAAVFGTLTVLVIFLFIRQISGNSKIALISAFLTSITPSEIFYSRKSFESVIATFFLFLGLLLLFKFQKENKKFLGIFSSFSLSLAMYFYTAHTIIIPLILVIFGLIFRKEIFTNKKKYLNFTFWWIIFITPLIIIILTNSNIRFRASTVSILQDANLGKKNIFDYSANRFLDQFNPSYLFGRGLDLTNQGPIGMGPLMFIQLPFLIMGLIYMIKNPELKLYWIFLTFIAVISMVPAAISFEKFSPHRSEVSFLLISIFSSFGVFYFFRKFLKFKNQLFKIGILSIVVLLFIINFIYFISMYAVNYPYEKSQNLHYPFKQISQFAWSKYSDFDSIIIDPKYGQIAPLGAVAVHYYLAYFGNYPPDKFQKDLQIKKNEMAFDKFYIRGVNWASDKDLKNTLIIASPWSLPLDFDKSKIIKTFNFYDGQLSYYAIKL